MALHIELLSDSKKIYSGESTKVILSTQNGIMEILPHHVEFVVNLIPGKISIYDNGKRKIKIDGGIGVAYKIEENVTILFQEKEQ